MRSLISCLVVLLTPFAVLLAAPAPFPRDERSPVWELILAAPSEEAYDAHRYLRSSRLSWDLAEAEPVRLALPLLTETDDRQSWLRRRLSVAVDRDGFTRLRVTAKADFARAVLRALVELVAGPPPTGARLEAALAHKAEALKRMRQMQWLLTVAPPGAVSREDREEVYALMARSRIELAPLKVHQPPRSVARDR